VEQVTTTGYCQVLATHSFEDDTTVSDLRASSSRPVQEPQTITAHNYKLFQVTHSSLPASQACNGGTLQTAFMAAPATAHSIV
jgi:hypothetical protein